MDRRLFGVVATLVLVACAGSETIPTTAPRLGRGNDPDRIRVREQSREPFTLTVIGCLSEPLVVSGSVNSILQGQDNPADNVHFRFHTNLQGVSGLGEITGTRYHLAQVHNATLNYVAFLDPPRFETNQLSRYRLIGSGPDNNSFVDVMYHITVTPNGRITRSSFEAEARCMEDGSV